MLKQLIIYFTLMLFFCSCKSLKEYRLTSYAHNGISGQSHFIVWFKDDFKGSICDVSEEHGRFDSVSWRYDNGFMYFKYLATTNKRGKIPKGNILPSVCLYSKKGIYVPTDSSYYFLNKLPMRTQNFEWYVRNLQQTGKEAKIIKRYFGTKEQIDKKLSKAKPLDEVFKKKDKIRFYWLYNFFEDINTELYILFEEPKRSH